MTGKEFQEKVLEMISRRRPFAVATVIGVRGSSSAKPGSKAIIDETGRNLYGWVGGGCAQSFICDEALKALAERRTRVVTADLDDEILGLGMPCGGLMDVYIEPVFPRKRLHIIGHNDVTPALSLLADMAGFEVSVHASDVAHKHYPRAAHVSALFSETIQPDSDDYVLIAAQGEEAQRALRHALSAQVGYIALLENSNSSPALVSQLCREGHAEESLKNQLRHAPGLIPGCQHPVETALSIVTELLAVDRGTNGKPLREVEKSSRAFSDGIQESCGFASLPKLIITGHSRITEELSRLGELFRWPTTINDAAAKQEDYSSRTCVISQDPNFEQLVADPQTFVVIASQHKGDHLAILKALKERARYVGMIASRKRSLLILDYLSEAGVQMEELNCFHAPAGLDLGAVTPEEIALSIMSEMLTIKLAEASDSLCRESGNFDELSGGAPSGRELENYVSG